MNTTTQLPTIPASHFEKLTGPPLKIARVDLDQVAAATTSSAPELSPEEYAAKIAGADGFDPTEATSEEYVEEGTAAGRARLADLARLSDLQAFERWGEVVKADAVGRMRAFGLSYERIAAVLGEACVPARTLHEPLSKVEELKAHAWACEQLEKSRLAALDRQNAEAARPRSCAEFDIGLLLSFKQPKHRDDSLRFATAIGVTAEGRELIAIKSIPFITEGVTPGDYDLARVESLDRTFAAGSVDPSRVYDPMTDQARDLYSLARLVAFVRLELRGGKGNYGPYDGTRPLLKLVPPPAMALLRAGRHLLPPSNALAFAAPRRLLAEQVCRGFMVAPRAAVEAAMLVLSGADETKPRQIGHPPPIGGFPERFTRYPILAPVDDGSDLRKSLETLFVSTLTCKEPESADVRPAWVSLENSTNVTKASRAVKGSKP